VDTLWSVNLINYVIHGDTLIFLYVHIGLNIILDVLYTSLSFKLDKKISTIVDLEEFKITEHTISTISGIVVSAIVSLLLINEVTIPYLLVASAMVNLALQYTNYKIYKELT